MALTTRKSAFDSKETKAQATYIKCVEALIKDGTYAKFVNWHAKMGTYRMHTHGFDGDVGLLRFLAWHRIYLVRFEKELQRIDSSCYIPYWKWVAGGIPKWMEPFKPKVKGIVRLQRGEMRELKPKMQPPQEITTTRSTLNKAIVKQPEMDAILARKTFRSFSLALEKGPHNNGHNLVGGYMRSEISPSDPMFWLHHSNVDRIWWQWQKKNPGKLPTITAPAVINGKTATAAEKTKFVKDWSELQPFTGVSLADGCNITSSFNYTYDA